MISRWQFYPYLARSKFYNDPWDLPKMASSRNNKCAHEFIMDFSEIRKKTGIVEEDIAKRLQVRWANCQGPMKSFRWLEDVTVEAGAPGSWQLYHDLSKRCEQNFLSIHCSEASVAWCIPVYALEHDIGSDALDNHPAASLLIEDYGFHAPTMSWPVPHSLMIEPTESEEPRWFRYLKAGTCHNRDN